MSTSASPRYPKSKNPPTVKSHYFSPTSSAPLGPDGRVVDTPEVARAKVAHLASYESRAGPTNSDNIYYPKFIYGANYQRSPFSSLYDQPHFPAIFYNENHSGHAKFAQQSGDDEIEDRENNRYAYNGPPAPLAHDVSTCLNIFVTNLRGYQLYIKKCYCLRSGGRSNKLYELLTKKNLTNSKKYIIFLNEKKKKILLRKKNEN